MTKGEREDGNAAEFFTVDEIGNRPSIDTPAEGSLDLKIAAKSLAAAAPPEEMAGNSLGAAVIEDAAVGGGLITVDGESRPSDCKSSLSKSDAAAETDAVT